MTQVLCYWANVVVFCCLQTVTQLFVYTQPYIILICDGIHSIYSCKCCQYVRSKSPLQSKCWNREKSLFHTFLTIHHPNCVCQPALLYKYAIMLPIIKHWDEICQGLQRLNISDNIHFLYNQNHKDYNCPTFHSSIVTFYVINLSLLTFKTYINSTKE